MGQETISKEGSQTRLRQRKERLMDGSDIAFSFSLANLHVYGPAYLWQVGCLCRVCTWMEGGEWRVTSGFSLFSIIYQYYLQLVAIL